MLSWLFGQKGGEAADVYVDLGTANTLVSAYKKGVVLNEPSEVMVSNIDPKKRKVFGIGLEGREILKKNPGHIVVIKPIKDGVIADFDATRVMLRHFLLKAMKATSFSRPKVVVSLPWGVTEVEKKAVMEACRSAGASRTYLIDEPMAAAIGAGIPVREAKGHMIVDIGGGSTEIAIVALADIVTCEHMRMGGHKFDEIIAHYLRQNRGIVVTEAQAEELKIGLATAMPRKNIISMDIEGREAETGFPKTVTITSEEIGLALSDCVQQIIHAILNALEKTPPELVSDVIDSGICLAGGGSLIRELPEKIESEVRIPVRRAERPLTALAEGGEMVLSDLDLLEKIQITD